MNRRFSLSKWALLALTLLSFQILNFVGFSSAGFADKDLSSWTKYTQAALIAETTAVVPGHPATLGLKVKLAKKWHTYWVNPGDSGTPLRLKFNADPGLKLRRVLFPIPERIESGPLISFAYSNEVLFPIEVQVGENVKPGSTLKVSVNAEWLVCEDVCIPAITKLELDVPVGKLEDAKPGPEFGLFQRTRSQLPEMQSSYPAFEKSGEGFKLNLPQIPVEEEYVDFFPFRGSGVSNAAPKFDGDFLTFEASNVPSLGAERVGLLVMKLKSNGQLRALQFGESGWTFDARGGHAEVQSLWWMLLSAFLGGLILNLMPCVFPILSMKLLGILKLGQAHSREVRTQNLAYVAGVLISFLAIALLLSFLRTAGSLVGWGFQLQSPIFLAFLSWLFFTLSLNLLGVFEIDFLNAGLGGRLTKVGGLWGSFFTGVLAVVVASPCTAPFMGAALGFGLSQPTYVLIAVFLMLGLGLAFPYLLFVFFPGWTRFLPRPGAWMNRLKMIMAVPMLATTAWMIWVLMQIRGTPATVAVIVGCALIGLVFAVPLRRRKLAAMVVVVLLAGAASYVYNNQGKGHVAADDGLWRAYSEDLMSELKGKNVFINMTADWCLSCKVNERLVFADVEVQQLLKAKNVTMVKGDWTQQSEPITRFLNKYNRVGVPFYVLFSPKHPDGLTLPEVLTKSAFIETINQEFP